MDAHRSGAVERRRICRTEKELLRVFERMPISDEWRVRKAVG